MTKRKGRRKLGPKVRANLAKLPKATREAACRRACLDNLGFRAAHDPLGEGLSAVECIEDKGARGAYHRTLDTLDQLLKHKTISQDQHHAGRRFERDCRTARLDRLHAMPMLRMARGAGDFEDSVYDARDRVYEALCGLGGPDSPIRSAAWQILAQGMNIQEHAEASVLGPGRSLERRVATGVFVGTLAVLQLHYTQRRKKKP